MIEELEAQVVTNIAVITALIAIPLKKLLEEKDNITSNILPKVMNIIFYLTSFF